MGHSWVSPPSDSSAAQGHAAQQPANDGSPKCYFCGQDKHPRQRCPARTATCNWCGRKGHFAKACQARSRPTTHRSSSAACQGCSARHVLPMGTVILGPLCSLPGALLTKLYAVAAISDQPTHHLLKLVSVTLDQSRHHHLTKSMMTVWINRHETACLFDSGSTDSLIHPDRALGI